jgi:methylmalonyl-CoA mutase
MTDKNRFAEFHPVMAKAWKQKIQYDLKGADYNETLVWESPEGIKVKPFYDQEDLAGTKALHLEPRAPWRAIHGLYVGHGPAAQKKAIWALKHGADGLYMTLPQNEVSLAELLRTLPLADHSLYLDVGEFSLDRLQKVQPLLSERSSKVFVMGDPIGHLARTGNWSKDMEKDLGLLVPALAMGPDHMVSVDAALYGNAGGTSVQQLAYALGHATEYLHHLHREGAMGQLKGITFKVAIGGNYFFEIAKIRALRWLWRTVAQSFGMAANCHILTVPTTRNKTLYAYNVNMLRTTTECMSAVLGGADGVMNLPYDAVYHKTNAFADRLALNQLLLLKHESHLDKVAHMADGAYYVEALTQQMAEKALQLFKQMEASGGFLKQLKAHKIQQKLKESAETEAQRYAAKQVVLVGSNAYRDAADQMKDTIERYPFVKHKPRKTLIEPIVERRLAETEEKERLDHE